MEPSFPLTALRSQLCFAKPTPKYCSEHFLAFFTRKLREVEEQNRELLTISAKREETIHQTTVIPCFDFKTVSCKFIQENVRSSPVSAGEKPSPDFLPPALPRPHQLAAYPYLVLGEIIRSDGQEIIGGGALLNR